MTLGKKNRAVAAAPDARNVIKPAQPSHRKLRRVTCAAGFAAGTAGDGAACGLGDIALLSATCER